MLSRLPSLYIFAVIAVQRAHAETGVCEDSDACSAPQVFSDDNALLQLESEPSKRSEIVAMEVDSSLEKEVGVADPHAADAATPAAGAEAATPAATPAAAAAAGTPAAGATLEAAAPIGAAAAAAGGAQPTLEARAPIGGAAAATGGATIAAAAPAVAAATGGATAVAATPAATPVAAAGTPAAGAQAPIATALPIAPFGKEDTSRELQSHAARTQDTLVDALENAEVAEIKRSVFRALTRLRAAEIKEFDTIARLETQAIDEYNDNHVYRKENPIDYLSSNEQRVSEDKYTSFHD